MRQKISAHLNPRTSAISQVPRPVQINPASSPLATETSHLNREENTHGIPSCTSSKATCYSATCTLNNATVGRSFSPLIRPFHKTSARSPTSDHTQIHRQQAIPTQPRINGTGTNRPAPIPLLPRQKNHQTNLKNRQVQVLDHQTAEPHAKAHFAVDDQTFPAPAITATTAFFGANLKPPIAHHVHRPRSSTQTKTPIHQG